MNAQTNQLLSSDHRELDELLDGFFTAAETGEIAQIYRSLDIFWARLAMHIRAENLHLFPAILGAFDFLQHTEEIHALSLETVKTTIAQLQDDHNFFMYRLSSAIKQLRDLREGGQMDESVRLKEMCETITAVKNRLIAHNELEETAVYRWADEFCRPAELAALSEKMQRELNNLPQRFADNHSLK